MSNNPGRKLLSLCLWGLLPLGISSAAHAWMIDDLGDLAGGPSFSEGHGLNDSGDVVGYGTSAATNEAFIWKRGIGMNALPKLVGSAYCTANGINNAGLVVGFCDDPAANKRTATLWQNNTPRAVVFSESAAGSEALAVNTLGDVSGTFRTTSQLDQAFTVDTRLATPVARGVTPLPADLKGSGRGNAINSQGFIAGNAIVNAGFVGGGINQNSHQPYLWNPAVRVNAILPVGVLPNATAKFGEARGINDTRQVVGIYDNRGFLWTPGSSQQSVGTTMPIPLEPYDINNHQQVVGVTQGKAMLYDSRNGQLTDLGNLPEVQAAGWKSLSIARAINDNGQITGTGVNSAGETHAFLLSPGNPIRPIGTGNIRPINPGLIRPLPPSRIPALPIR
jgi:probable HAF family extracellular repeat protein